MIHSWEQQWQKKMLQTYQHVNQTNTIKFKRTNQKTVCNDWFHPRCFSFRHMLPRSVMLKTQPNCMPQLRLRAFCCRISAQDESTRTQDTSAKCRKLTLSWHSLSRMNARRTLPQNNCDNSILPRQELSNCAWIHDISATPIQNDCDFLAIQPRSCRATANCPQKLRTRLFLSCNLSQSVHFNLS